MKPATQDLSREHVHIFNMLDVLIGLTASLYQKKKVPLEHLEKAVLFMEVYTHKLHHGKEEDLLFPVLDKAGLPLGAGPQCILYKDYQLARQSENREIIPLFPPPPPVASQISSDSPLHLVINEHREGAYYRKHLYLGIQKIKEGLEVEGQTLFADYAYRYADLLREHASKEDKCLFVMTNEILSDKIQENLFEQFKIVEEKTIGLEQVEVCLAILDELTALYGSSN